MNDFVRHQETAYLDEHRSEESEGEAIVVLGYPGAGKRTFATEALPIFKSKRDKNAFKVNLTDVEKKHIPYPQMRNDTEMFFSILEDKHSLNEPLNAVLVDVQSFEELEEIARYYTQLHIVFVRSIVLARHERMIDRELEKENTNTDKVRREVLRDKDKRVEERGLKEIVQSKFFDYELKNEDLNVDELQKSSRYLTREMLNKQ